jgi:hypothetical protein
MIVPRLLEGCAVLYLTLVVVEFGRTKKVGRFLWQIAILVMLVALALFVSAAGTGIVSFGAGTSPIGTTAMMFAATLLGIAARYIFYLKKPFSWLDLLKPLCISPIILLPLIGSVQGTKELEPMQLISFGLLAFQNGFFWEVVLERAKPTP